MKLPVYLYRDQYFRLDAAAPGFLRSVREAAVDAEILTPSPSFQEDRPDKIDKHNPKINTTMETLFTAFINALLAIAAAINNLAAAQGGTPGNITSIDAGKPAAAAATGAKPGAGGNADSLAKARAAAAAKKKAADDAAAAQADLDLLGGGDAGGEEVITLEMLRNKGMEILKAKKQAEMKTLVESLGATSLTTVAEEKYAEAYAGLEALLAL